MVIKNPARQWAKVEARRIDENYSPKKAGITEINRLRAAEQRRAEGYAKRHPVKHFLEDAGRKAGAVGCSAMFIGMGVVRPLLDMVYDCAEQVEAEIAFAESHALLNDTYVQNTIFKDNLNNTINNSINETAKEFGFNLTYKQLKEVKTVSYDAGLDEVRELKKVNNSYARRAFRASKAAVRGFFERYSITRASTTRGTQWVTMKELWDSYEDTDSDGVDDDFTTEGVDAGGFAYVRDKVRGVYADSGGEWQSPAGEGEVYVDFESKPDYRVCLKEQDSVKVGNTVEAKIYVDNIPYAGHDYREILDKTNVEGKNVVAADLPEPEPEFSKEDFSVTEESHPIFYEEHGTFVGAVLRLFDTMFGGVKGKTDYVDSTLKGVAEGGAGKVDSLEAMLASEEYETDHGPYKYEGSVSFEKEESEGDDAIFRAEVKVGVPPVFAKAALEYIDNHAMAGISTGQILTSMDNQDLPNIYLVGLRVNGDQVIDYNLKLTEIAGAGAEYDISDAKQHGVPLDAVIVASPADILVEYPDGKRVGSLYQNGVRSELKEIADAAHSDPTKSPEIILLFNPAKKYDVKVQGTGAGDYKLVVAGENPFYKTGSTLEGKVESFPIGSSTANGGSVGGDKDGSNWGWYVVVPAVAGGLGLLGWLATVFRKPTAKRKVGKLCKKFSNTSLVTEKFGLPAPAAKYFSSVLRDYASPQKDDGFLRDEAAIKEIKMRCRMAAYVESRLAYGPNTKEIIKIQGKYRQLLDKNVQARFNMAPAIATHLPEEFLTLVDEKKGYLGDAEFMHDLEMRCHARAREQGKARAGVAAQ